MSPCPPPTLDEEIGFLQTAFLDGVDNEDALNQIAWWATQTGQTTTDALNALNGSITPTTPPPPPPGGFFRWWTKFIGWVANQPTIGPILPVGPQ